MTRWADPVDLAEHDALDARAGAHAPSPLAAAAASSPTTVGLALHGAVVDDSHTGGRPKPRSGALQRWVRDIAIGVALVVAVPVATVSVMFRQLPFAGFLVENRLQDVASLRALRIAEEPGISPLAAGEALARLTAVSTSSPYRVRFAAEAETQLRSLVSPESTVLVAVRDPKRVNLFVATRLIAAAATGLSEADAAWLARVAALPIWRDVDLVARAAEVDVLAGRFKKPFVPTVSVLARPIPQMAEWRKLASFGVARAAWHVHRKEWAEAEAALRTVVSLGFVMVDDGSSMVEAMIGRTAILVGREGLAQLAKERGDTALAKLAAEPKKAASTSAKNIDVVRNGDRERVLAALLDPTVSHAVRMERHFLAYYLQCHSVREVLSGMSDDTRRALETAQRQLARFPSEEALLRQHEAVFASQPSFGSQPRGILLLGAASAASAMTGNPRIAACMAPAVDW